ncbi:MAG: heterodisulfide reductase-related iron-sulfur binding cluster, partial [bacterium]|nr:heterodisulfide reductase-related iron-sulfur binding cluster [bacterium]
QKQALDIAVPCSACYHNLKLAKEELNLNDSPPVRHLLDILAKETERVKLLVKKPLSKLKIAPYYGCLITRPPHKDEFDSVEQPQSMDRLLEICGCEVMKWSYKTDCCGAGLSLPQSEIVVDLVKKLINMAKQAGADCIVTACPMCQANLEMRQNGANMPVLYFTEVLGMALEMSNANRWLKKHLIDTSNLHLH